MEGEIGNVALAVGEELERPLPTHKAEHISAGALDVVEVHQNEVEEVDAPQTEDGGCTSPTTPDTAPDAPIEAGSSCPDGRPRTPLPQPRR